MGRLPQKPRRTRVKSTTKLPACHSDGRTNNKIVIVRGAHEYFISYLRDLIAFAVVSLAYVTYVWAKQ
jgi:hypothetical protein